MGFSYLTKLKWFYNFVLIFIFYFFQIFKEQVDSNPSKTCWLTVFSTEKGNEYQPKQKVKFIKTKKSSNSTYTPTFKLKTVKNYLECKKKIIIKNNRIISNT